MFGKKFTEEPLYYWEEKSYMMVIPNEVKGDILKDAFYGLEKCKDFKIKENKYDASSNTFFLKVEYGREEYDVGMFIGGVSVPPYYVSSTLFRDEDREKLLAAKTAITTFMEFKGDVKKCYHFQLKLAVALIPDLIGVLDESAERMLPVEWVKMTAQSKVLPSSKNIFSVQAVVEDENNVWLHTHGLLRCGVTELEILSSNEKNKDSHYNLLSTYGMFLLDKKGEDINGAYIGRLSNGLPVVATHRIWTEGLKQYKHLKLGGFKDRKSGHNSKTSIVFLYTSPEDEKNGVVNKISIYDELWADNPLYYFSDEETARMKVAAIESFEYAKKGFKNKDNAVLIKIRLPLKEKGKYEHIWFKLLEVKGDKFKAELTQDPYFFDDISKGYVAWYKKEDITDWIVYTERFPVTPETAFLLDR